MPRCLIIACGALAREIVALRKLNGWPHMDVQCLPAELHNRPEKIPAAVKAKIQANRSDYSSIFVAYGDCGTGGLLDAVLQEEQVERIPGAHCYEFFAGSEAFDALSEKELGTFYLTDFLLEHFERLVVRGLGLDRHPSLLVTLFGNYRKLVYLAQVPDAERLKAARAAAERLGLTFDYLVTGYGGLERSLKVVNQGVVVWRS
ncbi:MAG: DUF1638 domain-containing protein [Burkholderiales bacterium]|nr:DUF1638 domain-containing protein [Burkholderiales bacterium]